MQSLAPAAKAGDVTKTPVAPPAAEAKSAAPKIRGKEKFNLPPKVAEVAPAAVSSTPPVATVERLTNSQSIKVCCELLMLEAAARIKQ